MPKPRSRSSKTRKTARTGCKRTTGSSRRYGTTAVRTAADWAVNNRWLKQWSGWATRFNPQELITTAQTYRTRWEKDLTRFATYVTKRVKQSDWIERAREVTQSGVTDMMSFLNIPSQEEVDRLQRKLDTLEQRMNTVMLRGTRNR